MAAVGVPLMGYAMTHIATLGLDYDVELAKDAIIAPVTGKMRVTRFLCCFCLTFACTFLAFS
jgi:hypothetical protein